MRQNLGTGRELFTICNSHPWARDTASAAEARRTYPGSHNDSSVSWRRRLRKPEPAEPRSYSATEFPEVEPITHASLCDWDEQAVGSHDIHHLKDSFLSWESLEGSRFSGIGEEDQSTCPWTTQVTHLESFPEPLYTEEIKEDMYDDSSIFGASYMDSIISDPNDVFSLPMHTAEASSNYNEQLWFSDSYGWAGEPTMTRCDSPMSTKGEGLYCPLGCSGTFKRPSDYRRHMKKHDEPHLSCFLPGCIAKFYRKDKLHDHLQRIHGWSKEQSNSLHSKGYLDDGVAYQTELVTTTKSEESSTMHVCIEPDCEFAECKELRGIKNRRAMKQFQCTTCSRAFRLRADLDRHKLTHSTTNRSINCQFCENSYQRRDNLLRHQRKYHFHDLQDHSHEYRPVSGRLKSLQM